MVPGTDPLRDRIRALDLDTLSVHGEAMRVTGAVRTVVYNAFSAFSASDNGVLVWSSPTQGLTEMVELDRSGKELRTVLEPGNYSTFDLSQDGRYLAYVRNDGSGAQNIWVLDLVRGSNSRVTSGVAAHSDPTWFPDGSRLAFSSNEKGNKRLYEIAASGGVPRAIIDEDKLPHSINDWSSDGAYLLYHIDTPRHIWAMPSGGGKPISVLQTSSLADEAQFSPDHRWIAYNSSENDRFEVYVMPFPPSEGKVQVSTTGGVQPRWRGDGREIFYVSSTVEIIGVDVSRTQPGKLEFGVPRLLFKPRGIKLVPHQENYVVSPDGQRFYVAIPDGGSPQGFTALVNWTSVLKK